MSALARLCPALCAGAAVLGLAGAANAQESKALGNRNAFVLSLEHLGGYSYQRLEYEGADPGTAHQFGLFTPFVGNTAGHARLGLHYVVSPPVTIGGLLSYSDNDTLGTFVLVGARVGVALPMSGSTSIWLRGGIAYAATSRDAGSATAKYSAFLPGGEVLFALKPLDHFGFLVGGMFEMAVNGKAEVEFDPCPIPGDPQCNQERDFKQLEAGLTLGAFIEF